MRSLRSLLVLASVLLLAPLAASAVPILQLDIAGGSYDTTTETIVTSSNSFTVYAYATPSGQASASELLGTRFYLSIALTPKTGPTPASLGSFTVNGHLYNATSDMTYGVPPVEANLGAGSDPGDLSPHDIFNTFFVEVPFQLAAANTSGAYDTALHPGQGPIAGHDMFYAAFNVDKSALSSSVQLHFDQYTKFEGHNRGNVGDLDIAIHAPFSHDAGTIPGKPVPEPTAAMVFAIGLGAARYAGRRSS